MAGAGAVCPAEAATAAVSARMVHSVAAVLGWNWWVNGCASFQFALLREDGHPGGPGRWVHVNLAAAVTVPKWR